MKSRYGSAIGSASAAEPQDTVTPSTSAQARLDRQNAQQWSAWAAGVNDRLAELSAFAEHLMGERSDGGGLLSVLIAQMLDEAHVEAAEAVKKVSAALSARIEAEISVLHDEFVERLDATLLAHSPKKYKELVAEIGSLKDAYHKFAAGADTRLSSLDERIDRVDAKRRGDRNKAHREGEEKVERAEKIMALFTTMTARTNKRINAIIEELRDIRACLDEAEIMRANPLPPILALPPAE